MAFTSIGYDGTVNERQWAELVPSVGSSTYGVKGADDLKVSAVPGQPLMLSVAAGTGWGHGVMDTETTNTTIACDTISSGVRWDLIALRRDWQPLAGGPTSVAKVTGGSEKVLPDSRKQSPGVWDDQPLALVQWTAGQTQPTSIIDLRCWGGNGGLNAVDELALTYLAKLGAKVRIGTTTWSYEPGANGIPAWTREAPPGARGYSAAAWMAGAIPISTSPDGNAITLAQIAVADPGYPYHLQVQGLLEGAGGGAGTRWDARIDIPSQFLAISRGDVVAPWFDLNGQTATPITGATTVTLSLYRHFGSGAFGLSAFNRVFRVMVLPAAV